jgi:hypothetical protein
MFRHRDFKHRDVQSLLAQLAQDRIVQVADVAREQRTEILGHKWPV